MKPVRAGFLPLLDSAILLAAKERGFAAAEGIELTLTKETSWANVRDRLCVGQFDVAHVLAPLPIAQNLGLMPLKTKLVVPFALGLGGNAITVSSEIGVAMGHFGFDEVSGPATAGIALLQVIRANTLQGKPQLKFAVVHAFSSHAYELRYWLAASGIDPDKDVSIAVVPPSLLPDALAAREIDGFCVGEPWSSVAVQRSQSVILTTKSQIWRSSPEKVLAARQDWCERQSETLHLLIRALYRSAQWCGDPENFGELASLLSGPQYLGVHPEILHASLQGHLPGRLPEPDFVTFFDRAANFPWQSHALWFFSQMLRWHDAEYSAEAEEAARMTYRPDIYRAALRPLGAKLPGASSKVEGALTEMQLLPALNGPLEMGPDGFFDGRIFDPAQIKAYLSALP
jgi:two-component system, oxyanion-binding sensor